MNFKYFKGTVNDLTMEEVKQQYRKLATEYHPDHGGSDEIMKAINDERDYFIHYHVDGAFASYQDQRKAEDKKTWEQDLTPFYDIVAKLLEVDFDFDIQIIGFWIYVFQSYKYKDFLKELGFWFSSKHKAWVYSGTKKSRYRTKMSLDQIKQSYGVEYVQRKEEEDKPKKIEAA